MPKQGGGVQYKVPNLAYFQSEALIAALGFHNYVLFPPVFRAFAPQPRVHHCGAPSVYGHSHSTYSHHLADESDCGAYYQCGPADFWGVRMIRRECNKGLMFNVETGEKISTIPVRSFLFLEI